MNWSTMAMYGLSTFLLYLLNRRHMSDNQSSNQEPSKYTDSNTNQIDSAVPIVLGRGMIKSPLVSYYGDFRADIYTEEYGLHSSLSIWDLLLNLFILLLATVIQKNTVMVNAGQGTEVPIKDFTPSPGGGGASKPKPQPSNTRLTVLPGILTKGKYLPGASVEAKYPGRVTGTGDTEGKTTTEGKCQGQIELSETAQQRGIMVSIICYILFTLLTWLFTRHNGRVTIQKGFKYYLGWQNIICWTGDNIGLKAIWMNVYDANLEDSIYQGVWSSGEKIATKSQNRAGIFVRLDKPDLFGGVDEGGGFIGDIHVYLGDNSQAKDAWMINQMHQSSVQAELRGLTPRYPMYVTSVIPTAYIGKQARIPEMWFEIGNYPDKLKQTYNNELVSIYNEKIAYYTNIINVLSKIDTSIITYIQQTALDTAKQRLKDLQDKGVWHLGRLADDLNPAEAIFEVLTNDIWGCGGTAETLDIESLLRLGATCEDEGLGVSVVYTNVSNANVLIDNILTHINGVRYNNPKTGKLTFKLLRNDYDEDKLKKFDVSNSNDLSFTRLDWHETVSSISATFTDAEHYFDNGQVFVTDLANIKITHTQKQNNVDASYFTTPANAKTMAQTQLYSLAYPLSAIEFTCNRYAYDLTVGEAIKVNWSVYGIKNMIFRVSSIDYGSLTSGQIKVSAIEDVFSFDKTEYMLSHGLSWVDPIYHPVSAERFLFFEMPYELSLSLDTYIYAIIVQPASYVTVWNIWNYENGTFNNTKRSSVWSFGCRLSYELLESYEYNDAEYIEIAGIGNNSNDALDYKIMRMEENPGVYTNKSGQNLLVVDNEIISYEKIVKQINGRYRLTGIIRGVYDTLPALHTTESIGYFLDIRNNICSGGKSIASEGNIVDYTVEITTETKDEKQAFDMNNVIRKRTMRRSEMPSVMANLQFGADRGILTVYQYHWDTAYSLSGNLLFKFNPRNKFLSQTICLQTDMLNDSVQTDVVYKLKCISNKHSFELEYPATTGSPAVNIDNFILTWAEYCTKMGNNIKKINDLALDIYSYDNINSLESFASYAKNISYAVPRLVGIVTATADVQVYADACTKSYGVSLDAGSVSPAMTIKFNECPLIFVGTPSINGANVIGQDGVPYLLDTECYQIDGYDSVNKRAILHKVQIDDNYVISSNFTQLVGNTLVAFRYDLANNSWNEFTLLG